jgi:hypothetical protein
MRSSKMTFHTVKDVIEDIGREFVQVEKAIEMEQEQVETSNSIEPRGGTELHACVRSHSNTQTMYSVITYTAP